MKRRKVIRNNVSKENLNKELLVVGIFLFLALGVALSFVNTPQNATFTGHATDTNEGFIDALFTNWSSGNLDVNVAKYMFWIIVCLLIFSAVKFAEIPENPFLQWALAIIVSFLATAYITPAEVFSVLTGYTALGLTFSVIIPFVIMLFFSAMLLANKKMGPATNVPKIMLETVLWLFFVGFLIYKLISGYTGIDRSNGVLIVMWAVLVLSALILVFNKPYRKWIRGIGIEIMEGEAEVREAAADIVTGSGR